MYKNKKKFKTPLHVQIYDKEKLIFDREFTEYPIVIGQNPKSEIILPFHKTISQQHAVIIEKNSQPLISGLNKNIYFYGKKVKTAPAVNDVPISIGPFKCVFYTLPEEIENIKSENEDDLYEEKTIIIENPTLNLNKSFSSKNQEKKTCTYPYKGNKIKILNQNLKLAVPHKYVDKINVSQSVLEGIVTWHGEMYDIQHFEPNEKISVGSGARAGLQLPFIKKNLDLALYRGETTECFIPNGFQVTVKREKITTTLPDLLKSKILKSWDDGYLLTMNRSDLVSIAFDETSSVHFRYVPTPRKLAEKKLIVPDEEIRKTTLYSGFIHCLLLFFAYFSKPKINVPKIKNVPERYARLLVNPPKPKKKKQTQKIIAQVKKKNIIKKQSKPKKIVLKKSKRLKKINKYPVKIAKKKPVNVKKLVAAILPNPSLKNNQSLSININKSTRKIKSVKTAKLLNTLETSSVNLEDIGSIKTKGLSYGTEKNYEIQGLRGISGSRNIEGSVIGKPQVITINKNEGLTKEQVMAEVKKHIHQIARCYERALFTTPELSGRVEFEWNIQPNGRVEMVRISKSEMINGDSLYSCAASVIRQMKFPIAKNKKSTSASVGFPFGIIQ